MGGKFRPAHLPPGAGSKTRLKKGENNHTFTKEEQARGGRRDSKDLSVLTKSELGKINQPDRKHRYGDVLPDGDQVKQDIEQEAVAREATNLEQELDVLRAFAREDLRSKATGNTDEAWAELKSLANEYEGAEGIQRQELVDRILDTINGAKKWHRGHVVNSILTVAKVAEQKVNIDKTNQIMLTKASFQDAMARFVVQFNEAFPERIFQEGHYLPAMARLKILIGELLEPTPKSGSADENKDRVE